MELKMERNDYIVGAYHFVSVLKIWLNSYQCEKSLQNWAIVGIRNSLCPCLFPLYYTGNTHHTHTHTKTTQM